MSGKKAFVAENEYAEKIACGRSFDEQVASIKQYGNHGVSSVLRNAVLAAHGISNPKTQATYGIIFGCYPPFTTPFLLQYYIKLLDLLEIDYTWFDREYCCGWPLLVEDGEVSKNSAAISEEFIRKNLTLANEKEATTLTYCCVSCVHAAKQAIREAPEQHTYILDVICEAMEKRINTTAPAVVGYFEGCHSFNHTYFPGIDINWNRYRRLLDSIQGLTVVDLPSHLCCKRKTGDILKEAEKIGVTSIVCPCNGCYRTLQNAAVDTLQITSVPEVLLDCFK